MVDARQKRFAVAREVAHAPFTPANHPRKKASNKEFNSLDAQREACRGLYREPRSTRLDRSRGALRRWQPIPAARWSAPAAAAAARRHSRCWKIEIVVVYKVDRLTRSLSDFARMVEIFDAQGVSFRPPSLKPSIRPAAWGGSRSTCCCPSRNSSARSPGSESATRSPPRRRRACGWADSLHARMLRREGTPSSSSTSRKLRPCGRSFGAISNSGQCAPCETTWRLAAS